MGVDALQSYPIAAGGYFGDVGFSTMPKGLEHGLGHIGVGFKAAGTDGRGKKSNDIPGICTLFCQRSDACPCNIQGGAPPTGMERGNLLRAGIIQKNERTIGRSREQGDAGKRTGKSVAGMFRNKNTIFTGDKAGKIGIDPGDGISVNLLGKYSAIGGGTHGGKETENIFTNRLSGISGTGGKVEGGIDPFTDTTLACGKSVYDTMTRQKGRSIDPDTVYGFGLIDKCKLHTVLPFDL